MRLLVIGAVVLLFACGAQESGDVSDVGEATPPASAQGASGAPDEVEAPAAPAAPAEVASCLSLVKQAEFRQAVDVCLAALDADPGNSEVEAALAKARDETARQAAADAASGAASDAAADAAGGLPDAPTGLTP